MALGDRDAYEDEPEGYSVSSSRDNRPIIVRPQQALDYYDDYDAGQFDDRQRMQVAAIWGAILKHRWLIVGIVVASLMLGLGATLMMKRLYTAEATLQIDREASKVLDVEGLTPTEALTGNEFLDTQVGLLKSESLARRVVQTLDLARDPTAREFAGLEPVKAGANPPSDTKIEDRLTGFVMQGTEVRQQGLSRLVKVAFTSRDPGLSARVANALSQDFQVLAMERRFESSAYARKFLEERLAQVKQRLEDSEKELVAYGANQQIINVSPSMEGGSSDGASQSLTAANLSALSSMLTQAQGERIKSEQRWREAANADPLSLPEALSDPTVQSLLQRRATLAANYQEKLKVFAPGMPEMQQLKAQMDEVDRQLASTAQGLKNAIRSKYNVALRQEQSLSQQVERQKGSFIDLRERNIRNTILQREVDTNRTLYDGLLQRYKEVGVAGGVSSNNIAIVDRARPPAAPSSPKLPLNLAIALVLGMAIAGAATLLLELLDESVRTPDDVQTKMNMTVLGVIPELDKGVRPIQALDDPKSGISEAYSSARTAVQFATPRGAPENILVTSSRPSEGKSTTSLALARSFAHLGQRVLLIDADLRNPSIHRLLGLDNAVGLSNVLTGTPLEECVCVTDQSGLVAVPSGPLPPNPAELLASQRLPNLLQFAKTHFDIVIIDGPPVIGLADAPILSSRAASTVLVIESGSARRSVVRMALKRLQLARANLIGSVLTKFNAKTAGYSYGYGYGYGYSYDYNYGQKKIKDAAA